MSRTTFLKRSATVALSVAALCATVGAGSAAAASPQAAGSVEVMGGTPTCVSSWVFEGTLTDTAFVQNMSCSTTKYVRIVWAFGADSVCIELRPGQKASNTVPAYPRRFEGHKPC